jgi:hypothetical protein
MAMRWGVRRGGTLSVIAAALSVARAAPCQAPADSEARALALFKEALTALDRSDYATACPRFEAAMKLYPSPATQLNIARCLEHDGKIASAWAAYQRAIVLNHATKEQGRREALDKLAKDAVAALEPRLPRVRILVSGAPAGLRVTEGGQELPASSFGVALPTDPGPHELIARAPGFEDLRVTFAAEKGQQIDVPIALKPSRAPAPHDEGERAAPKKTPAWAWATGAIGAAALGVGAGFGGVALAKQSSIASACGKAFPHCPMNIQASVGPLESARNVDRAVFIGLASVGVIGITAGAVGIARSRRDSPSEARTSVVVAPFGTTEGGGIALAGTF